MRSFNKKWLDQVFYLRSFSTESRMCEKKNYDISKNVHQSINQILCVKSVAVAVRIETDKILDLQVGQLIHVECRAWFDGVIHDTKDMAGLVRFEVMLRG